jgi:hypothetical protein
MRKAASFTNQFQKVNKTVNKCLNPECGKDIPDDMAYCSESCLRKAMELRKITKFDIPKWFQTYQYEAFPEPMVNFGGAIKRAQALRYCLEIVYSLKKGNIEDLILTLMTDLGLTERRIREDYVSCLKAKNS